MLLAADVKELKYTDTVEDLGTYSYSVVAKGKDGLYTFEYEASNAGQTFTYLGAVFEGEEAFWIVQAYCLSDEYEQHQADMMKWLKSVKV